MTNRISNYTNPVNDDDQPTMDNILMDVIRAMKVDKPDERPRKLDYELVELTVLMTSRINTLTTVVQLLLGFVVSSTIILGGLIAAIIRGVI